jgi:aspartate ammonia-lyase
MAGPELTTASRRAVAPATGPPRGSTEILRKQQTLDAIEKAAPAVMKGDYNNQCLVDWYQGGAGTSTNMNANEVLANVAFEDDRGHNQRIH